MNMTMMSIKLWKIIAAGLLLIALCFFLAIKIGGKKESVEDPLSLELFCTEGGWGYQILVNKKILIYQPTVPAIDTIMPFPNKESAQAVGLLVLERIKSKKGFSVSKEEVQHSCSQ